MGAVFSLLSAGDHFGAQWLTRGFDGGSGVVGISGGCGDKFNVKVGERSWVHVHQRMHGGERQFVELAVVIK